MRFALSPHCIAPFRQPHVVVGSFSVCADTDWPKARGPACVPRLGVRKRNSGTERIASRPPLVFVARRHAFCAVSGDGAFSGSSDDCEDDGGRGGKDFGGEAAGLFLSAEEVKHFAGLGKKRAEGEELHHSDWADDGDEQRRVGPTPQKHS